MLCLPLLLVFINCKCASSSGTTDEYCSSDVAPTPSSVEGAPQAPTIQIDAGTCGSGGGDEGDGFCPLDNAPCCSQFGYCGDGEQYCFVTKSIDVDSESDNGGTCGGGGVGNGLCKDETLCCSQCKLIVAVSSIHGICI